MQEQKPVSKSKLNQSYKRQFSCVLTKTQGETLDTILAEHSCDNLSQLCKKIVKGELSLVSNSSR